MIAAISILVGILLIFIEFFVPGGIFSVLGLLAIVGGVALLIYQEASGFQILFALFGSIVGVFFACWFALFLIRRTGKSGSIFLAADQAGYRASHYDHTLKGREGVAHTDLRPGGFVRVEGNKYAAYSERGFVERGSKIVVLDVEGETLKVKEIQ